MSTITAFTTAPAESQVQPARHNGLYWALVDAWVLAKRRLIQIPRIPTI